MEQDRAKNIENDIKKSRDLCLSIHGHQETLLELMDQDDDKSIQIIYTTRGSTYRGFADKLTKDDSLFHDVRINLKNKIEDEIIRQKQELKEINKSIHSYLSSMENE